MFSHQNRLIEGIIMSSHNIPFSVNKKKITLNHRLRMFQILGGQGLEYWGGVGWGGGGGGGGGQTFKLLAGWKPTEEPPPPPPHTHTHRK